ncbi:MAG: DUF4331 family protein [Gammaproteobacteria bacterium]|nr:DUF4331 family protein [Gammaproteobacteria bacterium]
MFVGQRKDPFVVNLGEIFDLINTNPLGPVDGEADDLADKNVTSFILEIPANCLASNGDPAIGGWTTASVRQARLVRPNPGFDRPAIEGGAWTQVSRLGMPLVNELVIGLKDKDKFKDKFNASKPMNDAQFADYVTNPTLPALIGILYSRSINCMTAARFHSAHSIFSCSGRLSQMICRTNRSCSSVRWRPSPPCLPRGVGLIVPAPPCS